jgi:hypothetical protein
MMEATVKNGLSKIENANKGIYSIIEFLMMDLLMI